MKKIKILRIVTRLNIGGPAIQSILLTDGLNKDRFESILVAGVVEKGEAQIDFLLNRYNIKPIFILQLKRRINFIGDIVSFFKICKLIIKEKPHIVHTHTAKAGFIGRLASFLLRVPVRIHTFHGHTFYGYFNRYKTRLFLLIEGLFSKITDLVVAVSELQYEDIVNKYKVADISKCRVINLGLDLDRYFMINQEPQEKENIGFKREDIIVGTVGRITAIKNHKFFLKIAKTFYDTYQHKDVKFVIVGDGELRGEIEKFRNELGLEDKVCITGWQEDVAKYYSAFDIFVLTSKNEGTPVSMIEAMASGLPVVSTNVGGIPDLLCRGMSNYPQSFRAEYLIDNFDIDRFAKQINLLVINPDLRRSTGDFARSQVSNGFNKDNLITLIEQDYNRLLANKKVKI